MIIKAKKNASMAMSVIMDIKVGVNVIDKAIKEEMIVPIIPTNRHVVLLHKHFLIGVALKIDPISIKATRITSVSIANPKVIHTAVTILGIKLKAYNTPIAAPNNMLMITPIQLQAVKSQF